MDRLPNVFFRALALALSLSLAAPPASAGPARWLCDGVLNVVKRVSGYGKVLDAELARLVFDFPAREKRFAWTPELKNAVAGLSIAIKKGRRSVETFRHLGYRVGIKAKPERGGIYRLVVGHSRPGTYADVEDLLRMQNEVAKVLFANTSENELRGIRFQEWVPSKFDKTGQEILGDFSEQWKTANLRADGKQMLESFGFTSQSAKALCGRSNPWVLYGLVGTGSVYLASSLGANVGDSFGDYGTPTDAFLKKSTNPATGQMEVAPVDLPDSSLSPTDLEKDTTGAPVKDTTLAAVDEQPDALTQDSLKTRFDREFKKPDDSEDDEDQVSDTLTRKRPPLVSDSSHTEPNRGPQGDPSPDPYDNYQATREERARLYGRIGGGVTGAIGFLAYCRAHRKKDGLYVWEVSRSAIPVQDLAPMKRVRKAAAKTTATTAERDATTATKSARKRPASTKATGVDEGDRRRRHLEVRASKLARTEILPLTPISPGRGRRP